MFSKQIQIGDKAIGRGCPTFIVAEAGVAHFGKLKKALQLVDMAIVGKADAVKFQTYKTEKFINPKDKALFERYKSKELSYDAFRVIKAYCDEHGIIFFSTPHDEESLDFLVELDVPVIKVGSGEVGNWRFISKVAKKGKPVILSTGMYDWGYTLNAVDIFEGAENNDLVLLHCVTEYPCPQNKVNLEAIRSISDVCDVLTGYSDHTDGILFPTVAVCFGAVVIEKHISIDFDMPDAHDWKVSCGGYYKFSDMVRGIRTIEQGIGDGERHSLSPEELENTRWARKDLKTGRRPE